MKYTHNRGRVINTTPEIFGYFSFITPAQKVPFIYHTYRQRLFLPFVSLANDENTLRLSHLLHFDLRGAAIGLAVFARPPLLVFAEGGVAVFFPEMGEAGGVANFDFFRPVADFPGTLPQR